MRRLTTFALLLLALCHPVRGENQSGAEPADFAAVFGSEIDRRKALRKLERSWDQSYVLPLVEILSLTNHAGLARDIVDLLRQETGKPYGTDVQAWFAWIWEEDEQLIHGYPEFKSWLYGHIDPKFRAYFRTEGVRHVRLDEVRWGGVQQDGIPPLRRPLMITADDAAYLQDDNVVFGVAIDGDVRAYPKRILAWHEMFTDVIGGIHVAGVYCTLCGSMILYESEVNGVHHELGTSGFLYRSNKLMYDQATQSLWSTLEGRPVIGPLAGHDIELPWRSVVTTTWGEWKRRHPETTVLSLDTGHDRDYGEGVAYRSYFSNDRLMFNVPKLDKRLRNKAEVLGLRFGDGTGVLAIDTRFLGAHVVYHDEVGGVPFVVLTDRSGASRVYASGSHSFTGWNQAELAIDETGRHWQVTEGALIGPNGARLERLPAHRAFWFGWYSAYEDTRLVR